MDFTQIAEIISNLGFPIACVVAMFYMWNKERESHKEEADKWAEAFQQNTVAISQLKEVVAALKDKI